MEGATPAGGGKPSAADSGQTRLAPNRRARFWAASPTASPPSFAENPLEARSTHLRQDEHTLKSDPRPMAQARATLGTSKARTNRARGWNAQGNSLGRRNAQRQRRRAEGQRQFSRQVGTFLAQAPRRGFGGCRAVGKRERRPKTPRPMGQRPSRDEYGDDSRTSIHRPLGRPAGAAMGGAPSGAGLQPSRVGRREAPPPKGMGQPTRLATRPQRAACLRILHPLLQPLLIGRAAFAAGVGVERGLSTRFFNRQEVSVRRQPRGSFGSYATLANRVTNAAQSPASLGGAYDSAALITLYYKLRSLSFAFSRRSLNSSLPIVRQNKGGGLQTNLPTAGRLRLYWCGAYAAPAVDKFIHNPPYLLFCSAKVTWRFASRQASDALTITEAAFFQMSAAFHDS